MTFGVPHLHHKILSSTNQSLKALADQYPEGTLVTSEEQSAGRGRLGRSWFSAKGNLFASLLLKPQQPIISPLSQISLIAGVAVARSVAEICAKSQSLPEIALKWPNDIYLNNLKCGGILSELESPDEKTSIVVGLGLNINGAFFPERISATSLAIETGNSFDLHHCVSTWCSHFEPLYREWLRAGFSCIREEWMKWDYLLGKEIEVESGGEYVRGVAIGIDSIGSLLVRDGGRVIPISSGTVCHL